MTARLLFILAALFLAGCGASTSILPEPFTRERADGKIPVKTELIRAQVRAELSGIPEGEAEVARWQAIEADYHSCRLSSGKAEKAAEQVFADCMANRGYVYMYPVDAEQLHNDIAFDMEKNPEKWQNQVVTATIATSPITITNTPLPTISTASDSGGYATYLLGIAAIGGIAAVAAGGGGGGGSSGGNNQTTNPPPPPTTLVVSTRITPHMTLTTMITMDRMVTITNSHFTCIRATHRPGGGPNCAEGRRSETTIVILVSSPTVITRNHAFCNSGMPPNYDVSRCNTRSNFEVSPIITTALVTTSMTIMITLTGTSPASGLSYSPDIQQVVHAVMADGFNRGVGIGESAFSFSGRYDGNKRAAGFIYDFGGYAFRTDYIRLPSKQDSAVWLDTYRFGALTRINDEVQFYAGVDSYNNAIFAIDAKGDRMHRLGFAVGDGYAVKYEYRINL